MDREAFYGIIKGPREDGRAYVKIRDPAELRDWVGCMVRARVTAEDGSTAYRPGGMLKTVDRRLRYVYVVSLGNGRDYPIQVAGSTFWALPRPEPYDELAAWKDFAVTKLP